jgi:glycosyltransferase involved in cell wall biosynthesis
MSPSKDVCIITHNRPNQLVRAVLSILAQTNKPQQLIIIDSSNPKNRYTKAVIKKLCTSGQIKLHYKEVKNHTLGFKRNLALNSSTASFCCFIDDDEIAPPHWLATVDEILLMHKNLTCLAGPLLPLHLNSYWSRLRDYLSKKEYSYIGKAYHAHGGNVCFKKSFLIKEHISFDEIFSQAYEDFDMSDKITEKSYIYFHKNFFVYHELRDSLPSFTKQWFSYGQGNATYIVSRNMNFHEVQKSLRWLNDDLKPAPWKFFFGILLRNSAYLLGLITSYIRIEINKRNPLI